MISIRNFADLTCAPGTETREVLQRIDRSEHKFQVVVDGDGRLVGTVTDGDVRRAMLSGAQIGDPISRCMREGPVTGTPATQDENLLRLRKLPFLPLVDGAGKIVEILVPSSPETTIQTALVMAGGAGRRLGERTRNTPKPLLPVDGRPILDHILTALENDGVGDIFVAIHYLADRMERFVEDRENRSNVTLLYEQEPLGTAGAIGNLPTTPESPVLVLNGDVITDVNFSALQTFHDRHEHDATIAVARYDVKIPFGVVRHTEDGLFENIVEKPTVNHFVAAGIYYLMPELCALVREGEPMDMPDLLSLGRSAGLSIGLFPIHEYWIDIGRPDDLRAAEKDRGNGT